MTTTGRRRVSARIRNTFAEWCVSLGARLALLSFTLRRCEQCGRPIMYGRTCADIARAVTAAMTRYDAGEN